MQRLIGLLQKFLSRAFLESKLSRATSKGAKVQWFHEALRSMREILNFLSEAHKKNPFLVPKEMVVNYRKFYRNEILKAKKTAHDNYVKESANKPAATWNIIKKIV